MKLYTITARGVFPAIDIKTEPYPHIGLGEEGRGRKYTRFPVVQDLADLADNRGRITSMDVIKTKKGTVLGVPERNPDDKRAVFVLAVEAGYRGRALWTNGIPVFNPCRRRGETVLSYLQDGGCCPDCGSPIAEKGIHPDSGDIRRFPSLDTVAKVLATGRCAQGAAGAMGSHEEHLVILSPGDVIRIWRGGRLYGTAPVKYLKWDGEMAVYGEHDIVFPPALDEEEEGELI